MGSISKLSPAYEVDGDDLVFQMRAERDRFEKVFIAFRTLTEERARLTQAITQAKSTSDEQEDRIIELRRALKQTKNLEDELNAKTELLEQVLAENARLKDQVAKLGVSNAADVEIEIPTPEVELPSVMVDVKDDKGK
jgi:chromosome segregation ATPase